MIMRQWLQALLRRMFRPTRYRPEQRYMRGKSRGGTKV